MESLIDETTPLNRSVKYGKSDDDKDQNEGMNGGGSFDMQKIGYLGSIAIAVNSLAGPAMLLLPNTFQQAGLIPTILCLIFVAILSALCCLHMSNSISKIPGNSKYAKEIDYSETFEKFWGFKSFLSTQILFFCCVTCLNISSIVDTAQVVDTVLGHWFPGGSKALKFQYQENEPFVEIITWGYSSCRKKAIVGGSCLPFEKHHGQGVHFTLGYFITLLVFVPMALVDLKENAAWQIIGFIVLLVTSFVFMILFLMDGLHVDYITLWGESWHSVFGVILFNYALVLAVPTWLYEKDPNVKVRSIVNQSSIMSTVLYIVIGGLGAIGMPYASQNMLENMMSGAFGAPMQVCASVFAFFIIGLDCPLYSVLTRMNLSGKGLVSRSVANVLAVYLPYSISWLFYGGDAITKLLSWGGMLFTSLVAFILPLLVALHTMDVSEEHGSVPVYGKWNLSSKESEKRVLYILLFLSGFASLAALLGNLK